MGEKVEGTWLPAIRLSMGILFVLFLVLLGAANSVIAQSTTFFGEDAGLGEDTRLTSTPNADAARDDFLSYLKNVGTEDFESFADGVEAPLEVYFGDAGTATLQGTGEIDFTEPEAAFGFYGIDVGDFSGQLTITYEDGSPQTVTIPHTVDSPGGR